MWTTPDVVVSCMINVIYILMGLIQFGGSSRTGLPPYWKACINSINLCFAKLTCFSSRLEVNDVGGTNKLFSARCHRRP